MNEEQKRKALAHLSPTRRAFSLRYPMLAPAILAMRRSLRIISAALDPSISTQRSKPEVVLPWVVARHASPLMRRLGDSDPILQEQKITNLRIAAQALEGIIIKPGRTFSFWDIVGAPTYRRGYVDGMLLSAGKVQAGVGGGLCQMSNLLHWAFLHAPFDIVERAHHSFDVFPDSGRTLPFGSGATIFYNLIDLKVRNASAVPIQIHVWLTERELKIQLRSSARIPEKYHVYEKGHSFLNFRGTWFRSNEIWRQTLREGNVVADDFLYSNFAPVMYPVTAEYLENRGYAYSLE